MHMATSTQLPRGALLRTQHQFASQFIHLCMDLGCQQATQLEASPHDSLEVLVVGQGACVW
jgi:hypothetical protein